MKKLFHNVRIAQLGSVLIAARLHVSVFAFAAVFVILLSHAPQSGAEISATPQSPMLFAVWDNGALQLQQGFCVESVKGGGGSGPPQGQGPPGGTTGVQSPYDVTLDTPGPVELMLGGNSLPVSLTWVDITNNRSYNLQPLATTNRELDGSGPCDNARLLVDINAADLETAFPGLYRGDFQITLRQDKASGPESVTLTIAVEVDVPDRIRISGLNDIFLATFDGQSDVSATDQVCVFRASEAGYRVILRGDGPGYAFQLQGDTDSLPYSARWNETPVEADTPLGGQPAERFDGDTLCGGATNASLEVQVAAEDALAVQAGDYSGVLTVIVEME